MCSVMKVQAGEKRPRRQRHHHDHGASALVRVEVMKRWAMLGCPRTQIWKLQQRATRE